MRSNGVSQAPGIIYAAECAQYFRRHFLAEIYVLLEQAHAGTHKRFAFFILQAIARRQPNIRSQIVGMLGHRFDQRALAAFDQHLDGAVRQLEQLQHVGDGTNLVYFLLSGIILRGAALRDQQNFLLGRHRRIQRTDRLLATDEQWNHHVRKNHDITQWQQRQRRQSASSGLHVSTPCPRRA